MDLALAEMDRTGAWDRSLIMLVSTDRHRLRQLLRGFCRPVPQSRRRGHGDVAVLQAPLAAVGGQDQGRQRTEPTALVTSPRTSAHVTTGLSTSSRPLRRKPGGAHKPRRGSWIGGTLGPQALGIDRALWIGTPYASRWMQQVTGEDRPDVDPDLLVVANGFRQSETPPARSPAKTASGVCGAGEATSTTVSLWIGST